MPAEPGAGGSRCLLTRTATIVATQPPGLLCVPVRAWCLWSSRLVPASMITTRFMWPVKLKIINVKCKNSGL